MAIRCTYWTNGTQSWEEWVGRGGDNKQLPEAPKRLFIQVWGVLFAMRRRYSSAQMRLAAVLRQFCNGEVLGGWGRDMGMCFGVHQAWCLGNEGLDMLRQCQVIYWIWSSYYRKTSLKINVWYKILLSASLLHYTDVQWVYNLWTFIKPVLVN